MGCLNSGQGFSHWFGNIHFSGPCNRSCYFCIGQHMMELDRLNNLDVWPLKGLKEFLERSLEKDVKAINLTGSNTDPLLYRHQRALVDLLHSFGFRVGIRTNGAAILSRDSDWRLYDYASISFPSFSEEVYFRMMGSREVPDLARILKDETRPIKINIVLSPFLDNVLYTIAHLRSLGVNKINLREPYGQPHVGDPLADSKLPMVETFGMPTYDYHGTKVTYWDVHYCEVESVNLYANGRVSVDYPITRGHSDSGVVLDQSNWGTEHKRHREQWLALHE